MPRQHKQVPPAAGRLRSAPLGMVLLAAAACGRPAAPLGFELARNSADFGAIEIGTSRALEVAFRTDVAVRFDGLLASCGCTVPRLLVDGAVLAPGSTLPAGATGLLALTFTATGGAGTKSAEVTVQGAGPGLPARLGLKADQRSWYRIDPPLVDLGVLLGGEAVWATVRVEADNAFRLAEVVQLPSPLRLEGVPSGAAARVQVLRVGVDAATAEEGVQRQFFRVRADNGHHVELPVVFELARPLYTIPSERLLLGAVRRGYEFQTTVEVGAREGRLAPPEGRLEGFGEARVEVVTLEQGRRYRMRLVLPADLPPGPLAGTLHLLLHQQGAQGDTAAERTIQVFGVVQDPPSDSRQER
ncbi:MAG TPA: hypothetical protein VGC54_05005 [Planctomycetota bacterium]